MFASQRICDQTGQDRHEDVDDSLADHERETSDEMESGSGTNYN